VTEQPVTVRVFMQIGDNPPQEVGYAEVHRSTEPRSEPVAGLLENLAAEWRRTERTR
jgi:trehalose-6-phosphatase